MAKFLNTSATNYFLEELIKDAKERLILISPFLKLNARNADLAPACHNTVLRTSKWGDTRGNSFWGCPGYPKCRSIIPIETHP
ncbi:hypothetical protein ACXRSW_08745 [Aeromonas dhakensis]|uniref:hypothetical protein n=1 Tax=Aeromonas TaxID=642 RepID=UPI0003737D89|nr:hypothetical protein [Aeromonas dhakensis]MDD9305720.1 hypothetical protein [Aeromonas hydrophila]MBL0603401.1 hypothetical protein [Aeromonas dhakensis]MBQ4671869.1 hypothetical protein [Aeromonas dhakensis]MBQ4680618.1 hypothetical protein [Aeromonas dhakensis]MCJ2368038.1 hypothetical protein [Aeromonas dhakensis]